MYEGTPSMMDLAPGRCSAPNTANGMAKHKLLRAMILSKPEARAISVLAAHSAINKSKRPAPHIETAVREVPRNVARMIMCMSTLSLSSCAQYGGRCGFGTSSGAIHFSGFVDQSTLQSEATLLRGPRFVAHLMHRASYRAIPRPRRPRCASCQP